MAIPNTTSLDPGSYEEWKESDEQWWVNCPTKFGSCFWVEVSEIGLFCFFFFYQLRFYSFGVCQNSGSQWVNILFMKRTIVSCTIHWFSSVLAGPKSNPIFFCRISEGSTGRIFRWSGCVRINGNWDLLGDDWFHLSWKVLSLEMKRFFYTQEN